MQTFSLDSRVPANNTFFGTGKHFTSVMDQRHKDAAARTFGVTSLGDCRRWWESPVLRQMWARGGNRR